MFENVKITTLPNGARVATSAMPGVNSCAVGIAIPMGSRREKAAEAGWSHFVEHMVFKGSAKRPTRAEIVRPLERIGGDSNAHTGFEWTTFEARVPAAEAATAFDVLGDMVAHPLFPAAELEKERKVVLEEIKQRFDSPSLRIGQLARAALWPDHPLGRPISGFPETLSGADSENLRAFHRSNYSARGALVVAAGNLEHNRIVELARPFLEALPDVPVPRARPASRCRPPEPLAIERRDAQQAHLSISFRCPGAGDSGRFALDLLSFVLGGSMSSRLFRTVCDRHGLAYAIHALPIRNSDAGGFHVRASVDPARVEKALALCGRELRKIAEKPVGIRELADAKSLVANAMLLVGEHSGEQRVILDRSLTTLGVVEAPEEVAARFAAVSREEIRAAAEAILRPENGSLALILPNDCKADPEQLREALFNG